MKICYYETEDGYLCRRVKAESYDTASLKGFLLNGSEFQPTHSANWWRVVCPHLPEPELLSQEHKRKNAVRYKRLESAAGLPIPEVVLVGETPEGFEAIRDAYEVEYEEVNLGRQKVEVEWIRSGKVTWSKKMDPDKFSFTLHKIWASEIPEQKLTADDIFSRVPYLASMIEVDEIQRIMTPEFAWHLGPCSISSDIMFRLIRSYVKEHLNGKYATIKSDYDFVFEVHKRLPCLPYEYRYSTPLAKRKKDRAVKVRLEDNRTVKVLHLTRAGHVHGTEYGAKITPAMQGKNLSDLVDNINTYLGDLMATINAPVRICDNCDGTGIELDEEAKDGK